MDLHFTAKYENLRSGRKGKVFDAPWSRHLINFFEWKPVTMNHDLTRLLTLYPSVMKFETVPTPEQVYSREDKEGRKERKLSGRSEFNKEDDPMWSEEVQVVREYFPDPILPKNLDEKLQLGTPNTERANQCQNGMKYDVETKGAKKMPRNRKTNPDRAFVLTATESDDSNEDRHKKDVQYVDCWESNEESDESPKSKSDTPKSVQEGMCVDDEDDEDLSLIHI